MPDITVAPYALYAAGGTAVFTVVVLAARWLLRRAVATGRPTPNEARANAKTNAVEVMHAPDSTVSARVEQLRARGRAGK